MKLHLEGIPGANRITGYGPGYVTVNDERLTRSVVVTPDVLVRDWPPARIEELTAVEMERLVDYEPEVVLLGTGDRLRFPGDDLFRALYARNVGVEVMDTAAACRTYNILMAESRTVVAALLLGRA